jgi:hypothetical protein
MGMRDVAQALPSVAEERPSGSGEPHYYEPLRPHEPHNLDAEDDDDNDYYGYYPLNNHSLNDPSSPFFMDEATPGTIRINEKMVESAERWKEAGQPGGFEALEGLYDKIRDTDHYTWNPANQAEAAKEGAMLVKLTRDKHKKRAAEKISTQEYRSYDYDYDDDYLGSE